LSRTYCRLWAAHWRQLEDTKASSEIAGAAANSVARLAKLTARTLGRAHARPGYAAAFAGCLGSGTVFDEAVGFFATEYADQNEHHDHAFVKATYAGRIEASDDD
jgi:hypothetical protein